MRKQIEKDTKSLGNKTDLTDTVESKLQTLLKDGADAFMELEWAQPELPAFFDEKKFYLGQQMFYNNAFTMMIAKLCGLLSLFSVPSIKAVLMFTKQSSTPCAAFRRYVSTILHTWVWYGKRAGIEKECSESKIPQVEVSKQTKDRTEESRLVAAQTSRKQEIDVTEFLESLKIVRRKHCTAFRRSSMGGLNRVSQLDMALTQFGFMGFTLISGDYLGVNNTSEELEGLIHFWRVVGSMLGMEDKYNICNGSVEETRALCRRLLDEVLLPSLANGDKDFNEMSRTLIKSLWPVNPYIDPTAFINFTFILASSTATNNNHSLKIDPSSMSWYSRFMLNIQLILHKYLLPPTYWWSRFFRTFFNGQMRLAIYLTENFPFLAFWDHGIKKAYVNIFKYRVV